ncbi:S8 family serine peptidase [Salarchaeum sp. JOR-1]|uniref:S8 family serine peptidase n=1 Tax=Salarchaeum sp. JOR-1 TaxID=2599399 RepID=UPI0011982E76|nr:S8 family serine peptidase [Salarchaeum sp. JOR-1]QDX40998.1 S8 family serine peptidase [Salarchaeum sp. JOR-1]
MVEHTRREFLTLSGAALGGIAVGSTVTAAESTERFIVKAKGKKLEKSDVTVVHDLSEIGFAVVEGAESEVKRLGKYAPDVVYELDLPTDPITTEDAEEATDEPLYPLQWDKQTQNIPEAHEVTRGEGTRVAIVDTGVAACHPDLKHAVNVDLSRNFTGDGYGAGGPYGGYHGTHVAGIVAANDQNDAGVVGTAPGTEIVDCRVFSPDALASFADILAAVVYSANIGCDAANLSIGAYPVSRRGFGSFYGKVVNKTMSYARRQGTLVVVSAGNDAADLQHDGPVISLPNEAANVLSISATGPIGFAHGEAGLESPYDTPANYTNYGTNAINIAAPGGNYDLSQPAGWYYDMVLNTVALPTFADGEYQGAEYTYSWVAGTSMAAPQVAGAAALVKSTDPGLNANQVRGRLERTADGDYPADKTYYGKGVLDPYAAVTE